MKYSQNFTRSLVGCLGLAVTSLAVTTAYSAPLAPAVSTVANGSFEGQWQGWQSGNSMAQLSNEQTATGRYSLKITDTDEKTGCDVLAARIPVQAGVYTLRAQVFRVSGTGIGIYLRFPNADGKIGSQEGDVFQGSLPASPLNQWVPFDLTGAARQSAAFAEIWIHSYNDAKVVSYIDDLSLSPAAPETLSPPWKGTYKIKPSEKARLTAADVVGPDGVAYPDWRYAGKPGGIPQVKTAATIEQFDYRAVRLSSSSAAKPTTTVTIATP